MINGFVPKIIKLLIVYIQKINTNTFNENSSINSVTNNIYQEMRKKKKKVSK